MKLAAVWADLARLPVCNAQSSEVGCDKCVWETKNVEHGCMRPRCCTHNLTPHGLQAD